MFGHLWTVCAKIVARHAPLNVEAGDSDSDPWLEEAHVNTTFLHTFCSSMNVCKDHYPNNRSTKVQWTLSALKISKKYTPLRWY